MLKPDTDLSTPDRAKERTDAVQNLAKGSSPGKFTNQKMQMDEPVQCYLRFSILAPNTLGRKWVYLWQIILG